MTFDKLLSPINIGSMMVKNRFAMAPMGTNYLETDGSVNDKFLAFIRARVKGGTGLIILEATYVHPAGKVSPFQLGIDKDELINGLKTLTDDVHRYGAKICVQLGHGGRQTHQAVTGLPLMAPSPIGCPVCGGTPVEMTKADIEEIATAFGEAARRAKSAGADAVEIHGAHGYLINEFLSLYSNKRTDEYGGSLENRARFPLLVLKKIKEKAGADFPVIYRMSSAEYVADGLTIEDTKVFAVMLVDNGIDAIHVSGGVYESAAMTIGPPCIPQGVYADNAAAIREAVHAKVPIIVVHRIKDPVMAENIISAGKADMVAMGRALLADENLPKKVSDGRLQDIRKCIACNQGCIDQYFVGAGITCLGNPLVGRELEYDAEKKAAEPKKVLIIGGGPAGLETARVAALRGHEVFLYEKHSDLGGQMRIAAAPPYKEEIKELADFLISQVKLLGVEVRLSQELTESVLDALRPDVAVMATGSRPIVPAIKGVDSERVYTAHDILAGIVKASGSVTVVGGGSVGSETAEFLVDQGLKVTLIEMLDDIAMDVGMINKLMLVMRLHQKGIRILTGTTVKEILEGGIAVEKMGKTEMLPETGTVVLAVGSIPEDNIQALLERKNIPYQKIGDCLKARKMLDAIHEGFLCAYEL